YEAFELPVTDGIDSQTACLLVDEEYGAEVARHRRTGGSWRCPSRRAPRGVRLEFGGNFGAHFETFDPAFANVLVRYNPDGDSVLNARQAIRLRRLSDCCTNASASSSSSCLPAESHRREAEMTTDLTELVQQLQELILRRDRLRQQTVHGRELAETKHAAEQLRWRPAHVARRKASDDLADAR